MALSYATFKPTSRGISSFEIIRISFALLLIFSLVLSADMAGFTTAQPASDLSGSARFTPGTFAPGEVLVKFKEPAGGTRVNNMGLDPDRLLQDSLNKTYGLGGYQELQGMPGVYKFTAGKDSNLEKLVAAISLDPQVEYAEPNYLIHAKSAPPNDPLYTQTYTDTSGYPQSRQWYLSKIGMTELWKVVTGTNVTVAVLDTGLNPLHQDLCLSQSDFLYVNVLPVGSTDKNAKPDSYSANCKKYSTSQTFDFTVTPPSVGADDDNGHGTAVAGIIASTTNNSIGIAGINWNANILPVKVLDANGQGTVSSVSQGISYAVMRKARIINLSWSVEAATVPQALQQAISNAQNAGALIISAVGPVQRNVNPFPPTNTITSYPGAFAGVIGVGDTNEKDQVISSIYNDYVSVVAPGKNIFTTYCDFVTPQGKDPEGGTPNTVNQVVADPSGVLTTTYSTTRIDTLLYGYQKCKNPDYLRYPVNPIDDTVKPCDNSDIESCYYQEEVNQYFFDTSTRTDSTTISGTTNVQVSTTITDTKINLKSYYTYVDGSSYSAAIVSGLASLIVAANPSLTNAQIKTLIESSTDQLLPSQVTNGQQGHGRINAAKIAQSIIQLGGVIPQPTTASGIRGVITGFSNPTDIELNLDPVNRAVTPNADGGFLFDNLAAGTYYLRLRVKSSGMIMGPVKVILTGAVGEEFRIRFDITNNQLFCDNGSVCPGNAPGAGSGLAAFSPAGAIPGSLYFNETGHNISNGFKDYWIQNGGLAIFGYPLSEEFTEVSPTDGRTYTVQYFQRNRFEYHPENLPPYKVLLGLLGSEATRGRTDFGPVDPIQPTATAMYFKDTGHSLRNQFLAYWQSHGGLAVFGYPISEAFQEGPYYVQYFQRNRFELHPENFGTPYEVLLGLLGTDLARTRGYLP